MTKNKRAENGAEPSFITRYLLQKSVIDYPPLSIVGSYNPDKAAPVAELQDALRAEGYSKHQARMAVYNGCHILFFLAPFKAQKDYNKGHTKWVRLTHSGYKDGVMVKNNVHKAA